MRNRDLCLFDSYYENICYRYTRNTPYTRGVETHCENLYPRIVGIGGDVTLIRRSCYVDENNKIRIFKGVKLKDTYAPRKKSLEAIVHTFLAVIYAFFKRADVIHFHAIGPSIFSPLAKVLGMKVVVTHHGADYEREKWGLFAKFILKTGERMAVLFADRIIVISDKVKMMSPLNMGELMMCTLFIME